MKRSIPRPPPAPRMAGGLLEGKRVVVTGAAHEGNIGEAIARRCVAAGAEAIVTSRAASAAQAAARRIGARATGLALDVTDDASVETFAQAVGAVDGVVHNAGLPVTTWDRPFADVPMQDFRHAFEVDVLGAARLTRALLPALRGRAASLVFTSSTAAIGGYDALHEFSPAKAGVLGLMRGLAAELAREGVRSNAIAYGNIGTPATLDALDNETRRRLAEESPMRRWGTPHEAAGSVVFLLSELSSFMNGQTLIVDGGTLMR